MAYCGHRLWRWAAAAGVTGLLLGLGAVLAASCWENLFGIAVFLLAAAWIWELWHSFYQEAYFMALFWLAIGFLVLIPVCRSLF
ncbi:hypothetical protein [Anaerotignum lactatifermentans]|uniref:hypothetical protein n=1 Tax=Anaerotignum lactatifermentans TaxID=160404 RepID=UPI0039F5104D